MAPATGWLGYSKMAMRYFCIIRRKHNISGVLMDGQHVLVRSRVAAGALAVGLILGAGMNISRAQEPDLADRETILPLVPPKDVEVNGRDTRTEGREINEGQDEKITPRKPTTVNPTDENRKKPPGSGKLLDRCISRLEKTAGRIEQLKSSLTKWRTGVWRDAEHLAEKALEKGCTRKAERWRRIVEGLVMRWTDEHKPALRSCEEFHHRLESRDDGLALVLEGKLRDQDKVVSAFTGLSDLMPEITVEHNNLETLSKCLTCMAGGWGLEQDAGPRRFQDLDPESIAALPREDQCEQIGKMLTRGGFVATQRRRFWVRSGEDEPVLCYKFKGLDEWDIRSRGLDNFKGLVLGRCPADER